MAEPNSPNGEALRILLVEDNSDHAELVLRGFAGHRLANKIYHVSDGEAALDFLFHRGRYSDPEQNPLPHVILLDLRLPKVDGLEVLKEIKTHHQLRKVPVVVLTTSKADKDVAMAYGHHANSYLLKPVDFDKFTRLMDDLGFYWLGWNRRPRNGVI